MKLKLFPFLLFILVGCSSLGIEQASSFNDRLGYAIGQHTAVLTSAGTAVTLGDITPRQAENVLDIADNARALIDTADTIYRAGDEAAASKQLAITITILQELQKLLRGEPK